MPVTTKTSPREAGLKANVDLLRWPLLGRFLRWDHARMALQLPLFMLAAIMIVHGLFGPQLAPKNLATLLSWVHYRGVLVLVLLMAGNFACMACPFMLPRDIARRFFKPIFRWPRTLRNKWLALSLFVLVLFSYELFDLWGSPWWTAWLIIAYFIAALVVDMLFKDATFCKHVCPLGQFNFTAATVSPLEIKVRDLDVCATCRTHDCIAGTPHPSNNGRVLKRGCESGLFQPRKTGNMDCTFCLDCVKACPHNNIAIAARLPGSELWNNVRRSGIGIISKRKDLSALAILFAFGALLNAFGMVSPVYAVMTWLSRLMGTTNEASVLGVLFLTVLVLEPLLLLGLAAYVTRRTTVSSESLLTVATRFAYALIPLGFSIWLGHYIFHLLTGFATFVPVVQYALASIGIPWLGAPQWALGGIPAGLVYPLQVGFLSLGLIGSLLVAHNIAERDYPNHTRQAFMPWAALCLLMWLAAVWLLAQPMEMRGTFLGS